jgi:hypothetical protein
MAGDGRATTNYHSDATDSMELVLKPTKYVLVTGTSRPWDRAASSAARMVGRTVAERGFGLVTGNATGVDSAAAEAYCDHVARAGGDTVASYTQLALPYARRGSRWPFPGFDAGVSTVELRSTNQWLDEATARCAAVIMVGGHAPRRRGRRATSGALAIVNRFIEQGKPAFPIPFSGGQSDDVFQEVLARWAETPVPGLSRTQFLRIALPWTTGTGDLGDLLFGTLADQPDVFISYRRADTAWVAGRLYRDLSEHFGAKCVFMDVEDITAGDVWKHTIERALEGCRVGLVVIGSQWLDADGTRKPRLLDEHDVVRREIRTLLDAGKPVIVVLAGAAPPMAVDVPDDLRPLVERQAVAITNATWSAILGQIIATIDSVTSGHRRNA